MKVLRVGILNSIHTMNPRESRDLVSSSAVSQIFQTPFDNPRAAGPAVPSSSRDRWCRRRAGPPGSCTRDWCAGE